MTVRIILQMKDDVDEHLLEEAVAAAQARYPYLCVRLGVVRDADGSEHYIYHDNPRPWTVTVIKKKQIERRTWSVSLERLCLSEYAQLTCNR